MIDPKPQISETAPEISVVVMSELMGASVGSGPSSYHALGLRKLSAGANVRSWRIADHPDHQRASLFRFLKDGRWRARREAVALARHP